MAETAPRIGVDIGGTFTDVVLEAGGARHTTKILTTHSAPDDAILSGVRAVCAEGGVAFAEIGQIVHGATLATNALIERRGARTAFVTTEGFRDVIEMRSESRFEQYDLNLVQPEPLIPRQRRYTVRERIAATGEVLIPPDPAALDALADDLAEADYESIAIGFLHAYLNDAHEQMARARIARHLPEAMISISAEVSPQMREYERFNTTIANAYVKPLMKRYLDRLLGRLAAEGATCPVFLMHSGGGLIALGDAAEFPVRLVESGPAGGAVFAADIAKRHGLRRVLSFDMGGTTAKICLIRDGAPKTSRVFEVARSYRFKKGSGMPISIPVIDMVEIGAGGGSLAHLDAMRQIRVGPESAGSEPGPACYGRGGARPAVTDADLTLGRLDPAHFAGGSITLHPDRAEAALAEILGEALAMDAETAAFGVSEMVDETMANAARVHAVENGEDLAAYTMIAFGGAAPLHAGRLCEKLGIARLLVPPGAGVGSAIGFLRAPFSFEAARSVFMRLSAFDAKAGRALLAELEAEATAFVRACDADAPIIAEARLFMRYAGQGWEIPVALSAAEAAAPSAEACRARFEAAYSALFGRNLGGMDVEITIWSVAAETPTPPVARVAPLAPDDAAEISGHRALFDPRRGERVEAAVVARARMRPGERVDGPAIIVEDETSVVLPSGACAFLAADGCIDVRVSAEGGG